MPRHFPLLKRGFSRIAFFLSLFPPAAGHPDSVKTSLRLEPAGVVRCNFDLGPSTAGKPAPGRMEFRVGKNGDLYFLTYDSGKLWRFDRAGKLVRTVSAGRVFLRQSAAMALGPEGDLFLLDSRQEKLYRYDAALDLMGIYSVIGGAELDPLYGLAATSWGDLLAAGGLKSGLWKLEEEGQGFSIRPIFAPETHRYSFLTEMGDRKLLAIDPLGDLTVLDRYGNLLRTFTFGKGLRAAAVGPDFLATIWPYTDILLLDTVGTLLSDWKAAELDSTFHTVGEFQVLGDNLYFLLPARGAVAVFRILKKEE